MRTTAPTKPAKRATPLPPRTTRLSAPAVARGGVADGVVPLLDGVTGGGETMGGGDTGMEGGTITGGGGSGVDG